MSEDYGFTRNETEDGRLGFHEKTKLIEHSLLLSKEESDTLKEMAREMDISVHATLKQGLRVLQMYRAGYLIDNSPKSGGCGACE